MKELEVKVYTCLKAYVDYSAVYPITQDLRNKEIVKDGKYQKIGKVVKQTPATLIIQWENKKTTKLCVAHANEVVKYYVKQVPTEKGVE